MMALAAPLNAIGVDLFENDMQNVKANFEQFKATYVQVSHLVPEWSKDFPIEPVDELGQALAGGDQQKVMPAFEKVGQVCAACHLTNMPKAQFKYHWGDFSAIMVVDPLMKKKVGYVQITQFLDMSFTGITVDLQQGQIENARQNFQAFKARFEALKETCMNCHDTKRYFYIGDDVDRLIKKLGKAVNAKSVDPRQIEKFSIAIGNESCLKCHLVHVPAAYAMHQWAKAE